jgi:hypothetical protein
MTNDYTPVHTLSGPYSKLSDKPKGVDQDENSEVRLHLEGRYVMSQAESLKVILAHERIDYAFTNAAPNGGIAFIFKQGDLRKVKTALSQWNEAVSVVNHRVQMV